jgi:hypothetical protein
MKHAVVWGLVGLLAGSVAVACGSTSTTACSSQACEARADAEGPASDAGACPACAGTDASATTISASSYDQSCQVASDCVAIEVGQVCGPGCGLVCPNAAINRSAEQQYDADLQRILASCAVPPEPCGVGCPAATVSCVGGRCELDSGQARPDGGLEAGPADGGADAFTD